MLNRWKRLWSKKWFRRTVYLLPFVGILFYALHFQLPLLIVEVETAANKVFNEEAAPGDDNAQWDERLTVGSDDGLQIVSGILKADSAKGTVIMLHGIRASKEQFAEMAKWLQGQGWNAVSMDLRGHGESEGRFCTYGFMEKRDVSGLIDELEKNGYPAPYAVWGHSLGGAIALQSLEHDDRLSFGIVESTFSDLRQVIKEYFSRFTGMEVEWFTDYQISRAESIAEFEVDDVQPMRSCESVKQPVLVIHGDSDDRISLDHAYMNYDCLASATKEMYVVPGATHIDVWSKGGQEFLDRVDAFLDVRVHP